MSRFFIICCCVLFVAKIGAAEFKCPGVGDFPDPSDCNVIYKCKSRGASPHEFHCPPGTIFDQKCVWPHATLRRCDSSEGRDPELSSKLSFVCETSGVFPDRNDCRKVHICLCTGVPPVSMSCAPGLVFDGSCLPPHQSKRDCKPTSKGEGGEISSRSLPRGESVESGTSTELKPVSKESANDVNLKATDEVTSSNKSSKTNVSLTGSRGLGPSQESETKVDPEADSKSLFEGSRRLVHSTPAPVETVTASSDEESASPPPDASAVPPSTNESESSLTISLTVSSPHTKVMENENSPDIPETKSTLENERRHLPELKDSAEDAETSVEGNTETSAELSLGSMEECMKRLLASVSVIQQLLQDRLKTAQIKGSWIIGSFTNDFKERLNDVKTIVLNGLEKETSEISKAIVHNPLVSVGKNVSDAIGQGLETVKKTLEGSRSLTMGIIEIGVGLSSDLLVAGRSAPTVAAFAERVITHDVKVTAEQLLDKPIEGLREKRNSILRFASRQLRSMATTLDLWTY